MSTRGASGGRTCRGKARDCKKFQPGAVAAGAQACEGEDQPVKSAEAGTRGTRLRQKRHPWNSSGLGRVEPARTASYLDPISRSSTGAAEIHRHGPRPRSTWPRRERSRCLFQVRRSPAGRPSLSKPRRTSFISDRCGPVRSAGNPRIRRPRPGPMGSSVTRSHAQPHSLCPARSGGLPPTPAR